MFCLWSSHDAEWYSTSDHHMMLSDVLHLITTWCWAMFCIWSSHDAERCSASDHHMMLSDILPLIITWCWAIFCLWSLLRIYSIPYISLCRPRFPLSETTAFLCCQHISDSRSSAGPQLTCKEQSRCNKRLTNFNNRLFVLKFGIKWVKRWGWWRGSSWKRRNHPKQDTHQEQTHLWCMWHALTWLYRNPKNGHCAATQRKV